MRSFIVNSRGAAVRYKKKICTVFCKKVSLSFVCLCESVNVHIYVCVCVCMRGQESTFEMAINSKSAEGEIMGLCVLISVKSQASGARWGDSRAAL